MATPAGPDGRFAYLETQDARSARTAEHEIIVVGAGPVGLTCALDLARRGRPVLLLEADDRVSTGSRAICWAKRTLEIFDRLGVDGRMLDKGVTWHRGRVFRGARELWQFDLLPEAGHRMPAFINLQQYYVEQYLVDACLEQPLIELRWSTGVTAVQAAADGVLIDVQSPQGPYPLHAQWLLACDGVRSTVRRSLTLPFHGQIFADRFLIADVRMEAEFPAERWFWFDPAFHDGGSALLHRQPDNIWRIDLQLGPEADPEIERQPARVRPRLAAMLGPHRPFELEWVSVYTFQCRRLERFRHDRIIFLGDSAHQVSPIGARGGNGGVQDADNLAWKLDFVLRGLAPERLLESYDAERGEAADENIAHSTRATEFITPKGDAARWFRDAALELAADHAFARGLVNSGRLSTPCTYHRSPLPAADEIGQPAALRPGAPAVDAPIGADSGNGWLLQRLGGRWKVLWAPPDGLSAAAAREQAARLRASAPGVELLVLGGAAGGFAEVGDLVTRRYGLTPGAAYLFRPDQHVAARWRALDYQRIADAAAMVRNGGSG